MKTCLLLLTVLLSLASGLTALAEAPALPPGDKEPLLRVEAGGPTSYVTALAFSADGKTLYAGGWDKVVRVWTLNDRGLFVPDRIPAYRLPVGPGLSGAINAIALSADGVWLAAAGLSVFRDAAGFRQAGFVVPTAAMTPEMRLDMGTIYVFNTRDQSVRLLRGHMGTVMALAFAPTHPAKPPLLLSAARERQLASSTFQTAARLWNIDRGESVAASPELPHPEFPFRPGLTVWHTGNQLNQVRAALALYDGQLRVWDVQQPSTIAAQVKVPRNNMTVAFLPSLGQTGPARLLTADYGDQRARLGVWRFPANGRPGGTAMEEQPLNVDVFPRALGLLSSKADGNADLAAVLLRIPKQGEQYRLQVADLDPASLGLVRAEVDLWDGSARQPALATSLHGQFLAVAGNEDHEIRVYSLPSLLRKEQTPPQRLRNRGVTFQHVSFARNGQDLGLVLNPVGRKGVGQAAPAADRDRGDLIFDFRNRRLTADSAAWKTATPDLGSWRTRHTERKDRSSVYVYHDGKQIRQIDLPDKHELSDYALLPPQGANKVPLLALATHEAGQPRLDVYNAATGERLRQLTGHVDRLHALAFSADGRLLVSVAEDQTICVWSLTDLDQVLGRRGQLPGVVVDQRQGKVVVAEVRADSPAQQSLKAGNVIQGMVVNGILQPFASPMAFYEALFRMQPGQKVTLRRGAPTGADDVTLEVGQGVDESKPLLSLFVIRAAKSDRVEDGDWIGWNPIGPYESSSPRAEQFLGWHFNTGDPARPTRFALADAHRQDYYREGILQSLVAHGALARVEPPKLAPPTLVLLIEEAGRHHPPEQHGPLVVSHSQVTLKLNVRDRPLDTLSSLTWKLDDGPEQELDLDRPGAAQFAVPLDLRRGEHSVVVTAWTRDVPPQPTRQHLPLRYQPPPPRVKFDGERRQFLVREPVFDVKALVYPGQAGEDVQVTVRHLHDQKPLLEETKTHQLDPDRPLAIDRRLELQPGNNAFELVVVNRNAPRDLQAAESDRLVLEAIYVKKADPPSITFAGVLPLSAGGRDVLKVEPLKPVVVHAPSVRLQGKVAASENLAEVVWYQGEPARGSSPARFEPNRAKEFALQEELRLRPGLQTYRLEARTASSDVAKRTLTIDYRPLLPAVSLRAPATGTVLYGETDTTAVRLEGRLSPVDDPHAYRAAVLLNNKQVGNPPVIDERAGTLTATLALVAGDTRVRIRLSNAWGMVSDSEEVLVRYRRPPRILELKQVEADGKPVLNLEARVRSPLPLLRASVKVEVNGQPAADTRVVIGEPQANMRTVRFLEVPLQAGSKENQVRVWVSNAESECREPGAISIRTVRVLPPPVVEFTEPRHNVAVSRPDVAVRFHIRSASPLTKAQLIVEGRPPQRVDLSDVKRDGDGQFSLAATLDVELSRGLNQLRLEAVNASGRISQPLVLTYVPPPLRVVIDSLVPVSPQGKPIKAVRGARGRVTFPEVEQGRVRLHGRVLWADNKAARTQESLLVRVFVNGFQQIPARLRPSIGGDSLQTPFEADLVLSWQKDNHVSLVAQGQEAGDPSEFSVDCHQPMKQQRLHLLVLSPRGKDAGDLKEQVLQAVHSPSSAQQVKGSAFEQVQLYEPLLGSQVRPVYIYNQLYNIKATIELAHVGAPMNDVVMIYYQGGEEVNARGNFFQTYAGQAQGVPKEFGMACDKLVEFLAETPGAHVLLLDVDRDLSARAAQWPEARDKIENWEDDYPRAQVHMGVLRYAWLGKTDPPRQARLITAIGQAMPRASRLSHVLEAMGEMFDKLRNSQVLTYTYSVPKDLEQLVVGAPR